MEPTNHSHPICIFATLCLLCDATFLFYTVYYFTSVATSLFLLFSISFTPHHSG